MIELFLVFLIFGSLGILLILMNKILGPRKTNPKKEKPFECGSPYLQDKVNTLPIKYYLVAVLFLLFDIEVVFFFPWAMIFREMQPKAFIIMFFYIVILLVGFVYAWKKGAFEWER